VTETREGTSFVSWTSDCVTIGYTDTYNKYTGDFWTKNMATKLETHTRSTSDFLFIFSILFFLRYCSCFIDLL